MEEIKLPSRWVALNQHQFTDPEQGGKSNQGKDLREKHSEKDPNTRIRSIPYPRSLSDFLGQTNKNQEGNEYGLKNTGELIAGDSPRGFNVSFGILQQQGEDDPMPGTMRPQGDNMGLKMGEAEVLNPPFQFNRFDDVRSDPSEGKIGRYYRQHIQSNYPKVVFEAGDVRFTGNAISIMRKEMSTRQKTNGSFLKDGGSPTADAYRFLSGITSSVSRSVRNAVGLTDKYVKWTDRAGIHRALTNQILSEFASYMGLLRETPRPDGGDVDAANEISDLYNTLENVGKPTNMGESVNLDPSDASKGKIKLERGYQGDVILDLSHIIKNKSMNDSFMRMWKYIPYMIQNDVTVSETFSNSTKVHPFVEKINAMSQEQENTAQSGFINLATSDIKNVAQSAAQAVGGWISEKTDGKIGGGMGLILSGGGRLQVPEVWQDSSYSKSYNVSFDLYSPYGDPLSIFENVMVPLAPLLALTLPRKKSTDAYHSPFVVRATAQGLFNIKMGMIESMSISRGDSKNDRPTELAVSRKIKVNLTIKDLMPNLGASIDDGAFHIIAADNGELSEYLMTLSGISLAERNSWLHRTTRRWDMALESVTRWNVRNFTSAVGKFVPGPVMGAFQNHMVDADSAVRTYTR